MTIALLLFWFILSDQYSFLFLIMAIISSIIVSLTDRRVFTISTSSLTNTKEIPGRANSWLARDDKRLWRYVVFSTNLIKDMLTSTMNILKYIWLKPNVITPCYDWINIDSDNLTTLIIHANSITLTPGTMSMDIKDNKILVHALDRESMQTLQKTKLGKI